MRTNLACAASAAVVAVAGRTSTCSAFSLHPAIPGSVREGQQLTATSSSSPDTPRPRSQRRSLGGGGVAGRTFSPSWTSAASPHGNAARGRGRSSLGMTSGEPDGGLDGGGQGEGEGGGLLSRWVEGGKKLLVGVALASSVAGGGSLFSPTAPAMAASADETKEIGVCLLKQCRGELASCLLNPKCFANIICLQTCNGRADEGYCQIRCGDLFENEAVGKFNACAVSQKNCVKQRQDDGSWPVPPKEAQAKEFNPKMMEGQWFISAGLNPAFDCFDCQVHFFDSPKPGQLVGKLNWRITTPDGEFFTRDVVQKFKQDPANPAHLVNKDNEYLHYRDDWYVLDSEPNSHVLVVYRGSNDAWDGYGGGTLYTKDKSVPPELVARVKAKSEAAGIDWNRWQGNDNTCKPQASSELLREKYAKKLLLSEGKQLQEQLTEVRGFAAQEVDEVEASTLEKLEGLKQEYEVEVEQLGSDLVSAFEKELQLFEDSIAGEANTIVEEATRIEKGAESALVEEATLIERGAESILNGSGRK